MHKFAWKIRYLGLVLAALTAVTANSQANLQTTVVLDAHAPGRIFDGIGALSAGASTRLLVDYPEPSGARFSTICSNLPTALLCNI